MINNFFKRLATGRLNMKKPKKCWHLFYTPVSPDSLLCKQIGKKRQVNAFFLWAKDERKTMQKKNPSLKNKEISIKLGEKWKRLPAKKKASWKTTASQTPAQERGANNYKFRISPHQTLEALASRYSDLQQSLGISFPLEEASSQSKGRKKLNPFFHYNQYCNDKGPTTNRFNGLNSAQRSCIISKDWNKLFTSNRELFELMHIRAEYNGRKQKERIASGITALDQIPANRPPFVTEGATAVTEELSNAAPKIVVKVEPGSPKGPRNKKYIPFFEKLRKFNERGCVSLQNLYKRCVAKGPLGTGRAANLYVQDKMILTMAEKGKFTFKDFVIVCKEWGKKSDTEKQIYTQKYIQQLGESSKEQQPQHPCLNVDISIIELAPPDVLVGD